MRVITMNYIRSSDFWIINCNAAVRSYISKCVTCKHLRGNFQQQKMASLPSDRLCEELPFILCCRPIWAIFNQRRLQGAKALWSFIHMFIQQSHPHCNSSFTKYGFIHFVFMQIYWSQGKHQISKIR